LHNAHSQNDCTAVICVFAALSLSLSHHGDVSFVESASFTKLLQSLTGSQVVVAVSHDDMQTQ